MLDVPVADIVDLALPVVVDDVDLIVIDVDPAWSLMNDVVIPARFRWVGAVWFCRWRNRSWFCTRPPWNARSLRQCWFRRRDFWAWNTGFRNRLPADDTWQRDGAIQPKKIFDVAW